MKKLIKPYRHLIALLVVVTFAIITVCLGTAPAVGLLIVGLWQLSQFALSKRCGVCFNSGLTKEQLAEFDDILKDLNKADLPVRLQKMEKLYDTLLGDVRSLRKSGLKGNQSGLRRNINGQPEVDESCACYLGSMFALKAIQDNKVAGTLAENLLAKAAGYLGMETKAAIATSDIPLPVAYGTQIAELVYIYGSARQNCTVYPLSGNSTKLPRLKTGEPQFAFIAISGAVPEKVPQSEFITFTPGKAGGIIRIPSEIEEDSIFQLGQFVARYIAREMAFWEDTCLFLGDGTSTYNSISGIGAQSTTDSTVLQLASTNTSSDKITITNVRTLRTKPTGAILKTGKYYCHPTMEALFVTFNTSATVTPYVRNADGTASFDGFPIVWVSIMPVYSTSATVNAYQIHFGDLSWWYFGLRREMDVQTSRDVYFATDEIGMRALERFDIHLMGQKATGSLQLAAS